MINSIRHQVYIAQLPICKLRYRSRHLLLLLSDIKQIHILALIVTQIQLLEFRYVVQLVLTINISHLHDLMLRYSLWFCSVARDQYLVLSDLSLCMTRFGSKQFRNSTLKSHTRGRQVRLNAHLDSRTDLFLLLEFHD